MLINEQHIHRAAETRTGTKTGSGRAEERRRRARNPTILVDAMWETGET